MKAIVSASRRREIERLDRFWNAHQTSEPSTGEAESVCRFHTLDDAPAPNESFKRELEGRIMTQLAGGFTPRRTSSLFGSRRPGANRSRQWPAPRGRFAQGALLGICTLLLVLIAAEVMDRWPGSQRDNGMAGSIPAAVVTPAAYTCDVPPRSEPPAAIEGTPEPGPIVPTMRLENTQLLLDDADIPNVGTGEPIPDGALEGINATLRLFVECENAALNAPFDDDSVVLDIRAREFSFFTDDYLRRHKNPAPPETPEPRARALPWWAHEWQTAFWSPGLSMPALVQPVVLRDGGVGMKVVFDDSTMYYVVFAQVEGRWLIDEVAHTTTLLGEPASTPAPSFSIILSDILYLPNSLTITGNRPVNLTLANTGQARHSFNIDALSIHVELEPGEMTTVTVVGPAGTYEFYCDVPGHREAGMSGQLVIEEPFYSLDDVTVTPNPGGATPALCLACAATPPAERGS